MIRISLGRTDPHMKSTVEIHLGGAKPAHNDKWIEMRFGKCSGRKISMLLVCTTSSVSLWTTSMSGGWLLLCVWGWLLFGVKRPPSPSIPCLTGWPCAWRRSRSARSDWPAPWRTDGNALPGGYALQGPVAVTWTYHTLSLTSPLYGVSSEPID